MGNPLRAAPGAAIAA